MAEHLTPPLMLLLALREFFASDASLTNAEDANRFRAQMLRGAGHLALFTETAEGADPERDDKDDHHTTITVDHVLAGFSSVTYVNQLAAILTSWHVTKQNPLLQLPATIDGVVEVAANREALLSLSTEVIDDFVQQVTTCEVRSSV